MSASAPCAYNGRRSLALSSGCIRRWGDLSERGSGAVIGTGRDRDGIHSAVVRATGRTVVFESRAHLVSHDKVVYASDCPAISDDRIQLFRTRHSWLTCLRWW
jgi:hypothetical protein